MSTLRDMLADKPWMMHKDAMPHIMYSGDVHIRQAGRWFKHWEILEEFGPVRNDFMAELKMVTEGKKYLKDQVYTAHWNVGFGAYQIIEGYGCFAGNLNVLPHMYIGEQLLDTYVEACELILSQPDVYGIVWETSQGNEGVRAQGSEDVPEVQAQ